MKLFVYRPRVNFSIGMAQFLLVILLVSASSLVFAWGHQGHESIAGLADSLLSLKARQETTRLLSLEPGQTLVSIATWADENRTKDTAKWHFINFPRDTCAYIADRDCRDGQCAIEALETQIAILSDKGAKDSDRLAALKFVVHLMGDIHQPLHAGFSDDRGGNQYQVQFGGKSTNLHALWDTDFIEDFHMSNENLIQHIKPITPLNLPINTDVKNAAQESCAIAHASNFYPDRIIENNYSEHFTTVLKARLSMAGQRLATVLNKAFID
jgi:hypothetical protein